VETQRQRGALAAAERLFTAMRGGVWGLGTDESALLATLDALGPKDMDLVRTHYRSHYGRDLDKDVRGELSGADLQRASALLLGQAQSADAVALRDALRGLRKDKGLAFQVLERAAQTGQVDGLRAAYQAAHGEKLENRVSRALSGAAEARALALLRGDVPAARAHLLAGLLEGPRGRTRDTVVLRTLQAGGPELPKLFLATHGKDLRALLHHVLPPLVAQQADAVLDQDPVGVRAAGLRRILLGKDGYNPVDAVEALLSGTSPAERTQVAARYQSLYGASWEDGLKRLPGDAREATRALMATGQVDLVTRLHAARRDGDTVVALLSQAPAADLPGLRAAYQERFGRSLDHGVTTHLDGLDRLRAEQALRGPPATAKEAVGRLREQRDLLRSGVGNAGSRVALDWLLLSRNGPRLDRTVQRAEATLERAKADGVITPEEHAEVTALLAYGAADVDTHRDAVARVARVTSGIAGTVASGLAVAATGGAASPVLVQVAAATLAGGAATAAASGVVTGRAYTLRKLREDFGLGAIDGATSVVGLAAARGLAGGVSSLMVDRLLDSAKVPVAERSDLLRRLVADWFINSKEVFRVGYQVGVSAVGGAVSGSSGNALRTAVRGQTWAEGPAKGLGKLVEGALKGAATGTLNGCGGALVTLALTGIHHVSLLSEAEARKLTHDVKVDTPRGPVSVLVVGDLDAAGIEHVRTGLQDMATATGGKAVEGMEFVYVFPMGPRWAGLCAGENGFALASDMVKWKIATPVAYHENAHRLDNFLVGMTSLVTPGPFGKPPFCSDYAKTQVVEDVAETHEKLMLELVGTGTLDMNPATNPFAPKYRWLLDRFYPELDFPSP
jgi:hypothetical protein